MLKYVKIRKYELGLYFHDGEFRELLEPGRYWFFDPLRRIRVDVVSQRSPWLDPTGVSARRAGTVTAG